MAVSLTKTKEAFDLIAKYEGTNPYLKFLKRSILYDNAQLTDFQINYIIDNINFEPVLIDKVVQLSQWFAEKKQEEWGLKFLPKKILIGWYLGETDTTYHCLVKYKQNQEKAVQLFIPKKHLLDNFLIEDYNKLEIDFEKYDAITTAKDPTRKIQEHQKSAVKFLLSRKKCILADSPGLGKTTDLVVASLEGQFKKVVIVCPASIKTTWKRELMWYVPETDITIIESIDNKNKSELELFLGYEIGKSGKKVAELKQEAKESGKWKADTKYVIINYDIIDEFYNIPESRSKKDVQKALEDSPLLTSGFDLIILDEIHKLSNTKSIRYKTISDYLKRSKIENIYGVSGTPLTNRPMNMYNILKLLGAEITDDWQWFMKQYCDGMQIPAKGEKQRITEIYLKQRGKEITPFWKLSDEEKTELDEKIRREAKLIWVTSGASNLDELKEQIKHLYIRRIQSEVPGMVGKTISERYYELTPQQRQDYNNVWDEYMEAQTKEETDKTFNRDLTEGIFLRQFISRAMIPHTIKLTEEFIEDDEKVMIICCFDEELYELQKYFGNKCVIYNGKMSAKAKDKSEHEFMNNPNIKVFIGNLIACGVGLSLTSSATALFNSYSWVCGDNEQAFLRIHRISSTKDSKIYFQLFTDTISEHMWSTLMKKQLIIDTVIKDEKNK